MYDDHFLFTSRTAFRSIFGSSRKACRMIAPGRCISAISSTMARSVAGDSVCIFPTSEGNVPYRTCALRDVRSQKYSYLLGLSALSGLSLYMYTHPTLGGHCTQISIHSTISLDPQTSSGPRTPIDGVLVDLDLVLPHQRPQEYRNVRESVDRSIRIYYQEPRPISDPVSKIPS